MVEQAIGRFGGSMFQEEVRERFRAYLPAFSKTYEGCIRTVNGLQFLPVSAGGFALSMISNAGDDAHYEVLDMARQRCYLDHLKG